MNKKINNGMFLTSIFIAITVTFSVTMMLSTKMFEERVSSVTQKEAMYEKISNVDKIVRQNYFTEIDDEAMYEALANGYVNGLGDVESNYFSANEVDGLQELSKGKIVGTGIQVYKSKEDNGYMFVYNVYSGSPADIQGVKVGDLISVIDDVDTTNMNIDTAKEMLDGRENGLTKITIAAEEPVNVDIAHAYYDLPNMIQSLEGEVGYIRIYKFDSKSASDLQYLANSLKEQGAKSLCIDVRDNASKEFEFVANAADVLLKEGTTMTATYKNNENKVLYTSDKDSIDLPVCLIMNNKTAYAAEMFVVMLKDSLGAKTVGEKTQGKGTIQKVYRMSDGSGIELTVATLVPTVSESYNGIGIVPDYEKIVPETVSGVVLPIEQDEQIQRALEVAMNLAKGI